MKIYRVTIDVASDFSRMRLLLLIIIALLAALPSQGGAFPLAAGSETIPGIRMAICNSAVITGNVRHVALFGNDETADGSSAHPYRTLYRAVQDAVSKDTLLVHGGTYQESNEIRLRVPGVTIRSHPGEWAIIDRTTRGEWDSGIYFYVGSDYGTLTCIEVIGGFYVVSTETKWDWGDPNDRSGASHIQIENTRLHGSYADVIKIKPNSDDLLIRYNEIFTSGVGQPSNDCNAEGIDNVNGDRTLVAYNHIHDICSTGVYLKGGATDGVVEYNLIERTGAAGILLGFDTSPEYFDTNANPQYYENIRGIARYNLIRNPGWAGIGFYASKDAQAYRNTILNAATVYHSPIYLGISYQDWEPTAGRPPNQNPSISQNVVVSRSVPRNPALVEIRYANDLGGLSALTGDLRMSDNCYYRLAGPAAFHDQRTDWTGNLVAWQAHIQSDAGAYEGDPQLDSSDQPQNPACAGRGYTWKGGIEPGKIATAVEFYHAGKDHYFNTANTGDIAFLEANPQSGWFKTGYTFSVYPLGSAPSGTVAVARFYGGLQRSGIYKPDSHFYTGLAGERQLLIDGYNQACPTGQGSCNGEAWYYEKDEYQVYLPSDSSCPSGSRPVYRFYNNGYPTKDSNHRYTIDTHVAADMRAKGWTDEGVKMCTPN